MNLAALFGNSSRLLLHKKPVLLHPLGIINRLSPSQTDINFTISADIQFSCNNKSLEVKCACISVTQNFTSLHAATLINETVTSSMEYS